MPDSPRSLADDVRGRSIEQLRALVSARPDLMTGSASDLSGLAARAASRASVQRAVESLSADSLRVLEALLVTDGSTAKAAKLLAVKSPLVKTFADGLWTRALVWRKGTALVPTRSVSELLLPRAKALLERGELDSTPLHTPDVGRPAPDQQLTDAHAGQAALELLRRLEALAELWSETRPRVMSKGGVSVRDHKRAAEALDLDLGEVAFVAELAHAAGLIAPQSQIDPSWLPTTAYDEWSEQGPAARWETLIRAWWLMLRAPSVVGTKDAAGTVVNLLGSGASWPMMRQRRHDVLGVLAEVPDEVALLPEDVDALLRWHRPLRLPPGTPTRAADVLDEARRLGLVADGHLSTAGRRVLDGNLDASVLAPLLPDLLDHVLVQADLTAIAPGPLRDDLRRLMHTIADVESSGGATVFRFSASSLRRGLDAGLSASELHERLAAMSLTPLPQALGYLIDDVARQHGVTRVGAATSYLRSDDEALLDALLADRATQALQLLRLAPTVAVSRLPAARMLTLLREAGYSALAESATGAVAVTVGEPDRAPTPRPPSPVVTTSVDESAVEHFVQRLFDESGSAASASTDDPAVTVDLLLDAAASGLPVRIGYVDTAGNLKRVTLRPRTVSGGQVTGTVAGDKVRSISVHRITAVSPA